MKPPLPWATFLFFLLSSLVSAQGDPNANLSSYLTGALNLANDTSSSGPQSTFDSVLARVLRGVSTECKTCPHSLCSNVDWFPEMYQFRATCWTEGENVGGQKLWLGTSSQTCYIPVYDTLTYWRSYKNDLPPCASVPQPNVLRQHKNVTSPTACRLCPHNSCERLGDYPAHAHITLTCYANSVREECLGYCPKSDAGMDSSGSGPVQGDWQTESRTGAGSVKKTRGWCGRMVQNSKQLLYSCLFSSKTCKGTGVLRPCSFSAKELSHSFIVILDNYNYNLLNRSPHQLHY